MDQENSKNIQRTVIIEWITILTSVIACFGILYFQIQSLDAKMTQQSQRTDRLYEMFIDLIKENRCKNR